jgi:leucyl-tRNA synthetase
VATRPAESSPTHRYDGQLANAIEEKWIARWDERKTYYTPNPKGDLSQPNHERAAMPPYYTLDMFPYPSGSGLHVGHPLGYIGTDIFARFMRMAGFNVLHAMGYDAFGLPAERYAVDTGQHPDVTTRANIANMGRQLHRLGLGHDPRRGVATTDVSFYRWTQWIFLKIFNSWYDPEAGGARPIEELVAALDGGERELPDAPKPWSEMTEPERARAIDNVRLAYLEEGIVNWCPALGTVLANEEVTTDGRSEIGNFPVYRRPLKQWMMRITAYAERLIADLEPLDWPESLKAMQRNWIGRSVGARVEFDVDVPSAEPLHVFTTRPDTLFGVTFAVVAPEHPLLDGQLPVQYRDEIPGVWRGAGQDIDGVPPGGFGSPAKAVAAYRRRSDRRSDRQRQADVESTTGLYTGLDAIHPLTGERVPVFVADYVLMQYGSGAVMGVPAGDTRDFRFARKFDLPIRAVVRPPASWFAEHGLEPDAPTGEWPEAYTGHGESINSDGLTEGMPSQEAAVRIVEELEKRGKGHREVAYKLRDWLFSRQRYWGEPFPIVYDEDGNAIALPESQLPVVLPELEDYAPVVSDEHDDSEPVPPLARADDWVNVELDLGDGTKRFRREVNTMPQWAGSCWYYLRYLDPTDEQFFADPEIERYWMQHGNPGGVNLYVGGVEHAVLHLLYARFWHKVLFDLGYVSTPEPFQKLFNQGYVQAAAYTDERGFYVEASEVEERDGRFLFDGRPVTRSYGKMGKSLKNSVTPDDVIAEYGADALRLYEMFLGPLDQDRPWETQGITGVSRFLQRVWRYVIDEETGEPRLSGEDPPIELQRTLHRRIADVRRDIERMHFNTAISTLMELSNELRAADTGAGAPRQAAEWLVLGLAPFAPHMSEELWERLGHDDSIVFASFPEPDPELTAVQTVSVAVQVNGKVRGVAEVAAGSDSQTLEAAARELPRVSDQLNGAEVKRVVVVPDRLVNFVIAPR